VSVIQLPENNLPRTLSLTDLFSPLTRSEEILVHRILGQPLVQLGHGTFRLKEVEDEPDLFQLSFCRLRSESRGDGDARWGVLDGRQGGRGGSRRWIGRHGE
jgi:hypothetical protein